MLALTSRVKALVAITTVATAAYGGWWLRDLQAEAEAIAAAKAQLAADKRMAELADKVAVKTEEAINGIRIENRTIYNEVQREVQTNTVYRECRIPDDGLRLANAARAGSTRKPGASMPAASTASGEGNNGRPAGR